MGEKAAAGGRAQPALAVISEALSRDPGAVGGTGRIFNMPAKSPIMTGSATGLTPSVGAIMTKNAFGVDVLSRPFTCPRNRVQQLVPKRGTQDLFYPNLRATGNYVIEEGEGMICSITLEYKGLLNGAIPDPVVSYGSLTKSVSLTRTRTLSGSDDQSGSTVYIYSVLYVTDVAKVQFVSDNLRTRPAIELSKDAFGYRILQSTYVVGSSPNAELVGREGAGNPISPSISVISDGVTRNRVPGTPFYECEMSHYFNIA
ncbi:MAG TPA: hypothetical protein PLS03_06810 [Terrimicrobiaceae bacterium]|nr:hypothetical protein [Terrimicrobiaceae bacterium]